jgi:hypothetical protein
MFYVLLFAPWYFLDEIRIKKTKLRDVGYVVIRDLNMNMVIKEKLVALETMLFTRERNAADLADLIDDEFIERGKSGQFYGKNEVLSWLEQTSGAFISGDQFQVKKLTDDVILLTYISTTQSSSDNKAQHAFRSSIWRNQHGNWRMVYHQATPMDK